MIGPVFPSEDAGRHGPVKTDLRQSAEEIVPRNLSLANIQVLMHTSLRSGWVQDVAQAGACLVIERVADMHVSENILCLAQHRLGIIAEVECVRRAIEELHIL